MECHTLLERSYKALLGFVKFGSPNQTIWWSLVRGPWRLKNFEFKNFTYIHFTNYVKFFKYINKKLIFRHLFLNWDLANLGHLRPTLSIWLNKNAYYWLIWCQRHPLKVPIELPDYECHYLEVHECLEAFWLSQVDKVGLK